MRLEGAVRRANGEAQPGRINGNVTAAAVVLMKWRRFMLAGVDGFMEFGVELFWYIPFAKKLAIKNFVFFSPLNRGGAAPTKSSPRNFWLAIDRKLLAERRSPVLNRRECAAG